MLPDRHAIESALCQYLAANVLAPGVQLTPESDLAALDVDSVTMVELVMLIEETFRIEIPVHKMLPQHLRSVHTLALCAIVHGKPIR